MDDKRRGKLCLAAKSTFVIGTWRHLSFRKTALLSLMLLLFLSYGVSYIYQYTSGSFNKGVNNKEGILKTIMESPHRNVQVAEKERRLPKCILIGVSKGGTRALIEFLNHLHPDIVAYIGEVNFFDKDSKYSKGLDFYRSLMPLSFANQITIEKTPAYFDTEKVPRRVNQMNSSINLLLTVRNPVKRIVSQFTQRWNKGKQVLPFQTELFDDHGNVNWTSKYVIRSTYHKHFTRWLQFFPRQQIHIVDGENFVMDPYDELFKIETFLGIGNKISQRNIQFDSMKGFHCMVVRNATKCLGSKKGADHVHVPETPLEKLRKYFEPLNERFFEITGTRFNWTRNIAEH